MEKTFSQMDDKAKNFMFFFLHIICITAAGLFLYGLYVSKYKSDMEIYNFYASGKIMIEYLVLSLCECLGGSFFMDYIFRKSEYVS